MSQRRKLLAVGICLAFGFGPNALVHAKTLVQLTGWDQTAVLIPAGGRDSFELTANVSWPRDLTGNLSLQVTMPLGRVENQPLQVDPDQIPRRLLIHVPANAVRNVPPADLIVRVLVVNPATNTALSNSSRPRFATSHIPAPKPQTSLEGRLAGERLWMVRPEQLDSCPVPGPLDLLFVRIPSQGTQPGYFIATTELSNAQASRLLPDYDPRAGRSDEFLLEAPAQPAVGLTPRKAQDLLARLTKLDPAGAVYRLPTVAEWDRAAKAGRTAPYWWGDKPENGEAANFLGSEPSLSEDTTASARPGTRGPRFQASPWHLFHTFGNVAEWATATPQSFARLGGHFRTEPAESTAKIEVTDPNTLGPDPYVGVRPVFDVDAPTGSALAKKLLAGDPRLAKLQVQFDPDRATLTLQGTLAESSWRSLADRKLATLWFVAAVENRVETPTFAKGQLARIGGLAGPVRRITPLGRWFDEIPLEVRWANPLPVSGSEWWVNIYLPGGGHQSHRLSSTEPDPSRRFTALVERARNSASGNAAEATVSVAISLGGEAAGPTDPRIVSNVVPVRWQMK